VSHGPAATPTANIHSDQTRVRRQLRFGFPAGNAIGPMVTGMLKGC